MKTKIIGVIGNPEIDNEGYPLTALYNEYKNVIVDNDCIPFMICPLSNIDYFNTETDEVPELTDKEKKMYKSMVDICDGILVQGAYKLYNYDEFIVRYALKKNMPILGICAGMQLLANIDNGYDCLNLIDGEINHQQLNKEYVHNIRIINNTLLSNIVGNNTIKVNSRHKYKISGVNKFKISAISEDGIIEGIELPEKLFVLGVQWHPEKLYDKDEYSKKIIKEFIKKVTEYSMCK